MKFEKTFQALTGHPPFPWQIALFELFRKGEIPEICSLPTGMGKTSIIAVWLVALAEAPDKVPRRLVYVVNRRTVVDQTTVEVEKYRENVQAAGLDAQLRSLCAIPLKDGDSPLAISTLRGQFADNREWSIDPARPAVICGTVDMIGSRLLFSGYGCGFKSKPLHAGFLGQDVLLVHDEAHLEPAFQELLKTIEKEQTVAEPSRATTKACLPWKPLRVMELTATPRGKGEAFVLTDPERNPPEPIPVSLTEPIHHVWVRLCAKKALCFHPVKRDQVATEMAKRARDQWGSMDQAVLLFVRTINDVEDVRNELTRKRKDGPLELREGVNPLQIQVLTGTMRGLERDKLATEDPVFARFMPNPKVETTKGTVYLICTSAGEVGVDISAEHLVCDLSTLDSMAQRFGRVNRRGLGDSMIDVFFEIDRNPKPPSPEFEAARWKSKETLERLPQCERDGVQDRHEASPLKLGELFEATTDAEREDKAKERQAAFAPTPTILPATDILFDSWALTTIREKLPGRPPVEPYLHGLSSWEPPQTQIAWREEVEVIQGELMAEYSPDDLLELLDEFPVKPHEILTDRTKRVLDQLHAFPNTEKYHSRPVWVVSPDTVEVTKLGELRNLDRKRAEEYLKDKMLLLPPSIGGLSKGLLTPGSADEVTDISSETFIDREKSIRRRCRIWDDNPNATPDDNPNATPGDKAMRRLVRIDTNSDPDDAVHEEDAEETLSDNQNAATCKPPKRYWLWFERVDHGDELGGRTSKRAITWDDHTNDVTANAQKIADKLLEDHPCLHTALLTAARWHDLGKKRDIWQRSIGRPTPKPGEQAVWYAKSDPSWPSESIRTSYRHEFGSLVDILCGSDHAIQGEYQALTPHVRELVLHLIAVHHGFGRPHFPEDRAFDLDPKGYDTTQLASDIPRRFAKLQRQYGRWGLAYLESLLRAADAAASANPSDESLSTEEARS